jgi:hypothetical protein
MASELRRNDPQPVTVFVYSEAGVLLATKAAAVE